MLVTLQKETGEAHLTLNMDKTKCVPITELVIFNVAYSQQGMFLPQKTPYRWLEKQTTNRKGKLKTIQDKVQSFSSWLRHYRSIDPRILLHPETIANIQSMLESLEDTELAKQLEDAYQEFQQQLIGSIGSTASSSVLTQMNNAAEKEIVLSGNSAQTSSHLANQTTPLPSSPPAVEPHRFARLGSLLIHDPALFTETALARPVLTAAGLCNLGSVYGTVRTVTRQSVHQQADLCTNPSAGLASLIWLQGQAYAYNTGTRFPTETDVPNKTTPDLLEHDLGIIQPEFGF